MTRTANVTRAPTVAVGYTELSIVTVVALLVESGCDGLLEPIISEPAEGVNTADSCDGELVAPNDVWHVTSTDGVSCTGIGTVEQPAIGTPLFSNETVPAGGRPPASDVTVEIRVTLSLVTGGSSLVSTLSDVVLGANCVRRSGWTTASPSTASTTICPGVSELVSVDV